MPWDWGLGAAGLPSLHQENNAIKLWIPQVSVEDPDPKMNLYSGPDPYSVSRKVNIG